MQFANEPATIAAFPADVKPQGGDQVGCQRSLPGEAVLAADLITILKIDSWQFVAALAAKKHENA